MTLGKTRLYLALLAGVLMVIAGCTKNPGSSETGVRSAAPNPRRMFKDVRQVSVNSIVAKRGDRPYRSGRSPDWIKVKNPDAPAATRVIE